MASGIDWFRWHHGSVTDPKFQLVAKKAGCSVAEVIAFWAFILESASQSSERGNPGVIDFESVEFFLGLKEGQATLIHAAMKSRGLIDEDGSISSWNKRQPKRERENDNSAERVANYRKRLDDDSNAELIHIEACNANENHVTPSNANTNQETPREEKRRVNNKNNIPRSARFDFLGALIAKGVPESVASDYIATRKAKHCVQTETAFGQLVAQADISGMPFTEVVLLCCRKGWGGFDASWVTDRERGKPKPFGGDGDPAEIITLPDGRQMTRAQRDFVLRVSA